MTTTFMLRVASAISALFTIGHSLGGLENWSPFGDNPVIRAMAATHFHTAGGSRSYLDFYLGLGWTVNRPESDSPGGSASPPSRCRWASGAGACWPGPGP